MSTSSQAERWLAAEPDDDIRTELAEIIATGDVDECFGGHLTFGTAGLRARIGAGPLRMNRLVVRQAAAGLVDHLLTVDPTNAGRGIVIGWDARRKSEAFAIDTARVAAARGVRALLMPHVVPTPVLAWNIQPHRAAAGVMVTASHNPPADNGYKVYLDSGAQIVPPDDAAIAAAIAAIDPTTVELAPDDHPLIVRLDSAPLDEYLAWVGSVRLTSGAISVPFAYTPLHGVGGDVALRAFARAGIGAPSIVESQFAPDADFPTVDFPNPEEPGAMDAVIARAERSGARLAVAHDPDADRLGVAVADRHGTWRLLRGDEIGWLLADHIVKHTSGGDRLMVSTVVSSTLVGEMARAAGIEFAETFTGFKWIAAAVRTRPAKRLVFAYEQALGYLVADRPLDKDGITAAIVLMEIAEEAAREGSDLLGRLDDIARRFGRHVTTERSVAMVPAAGVAAVDRLRLNPPHEIAGHEVVSVDHIPEATLVRIMLRGADGTASIRLQVRPSGTEPKVKLYGEAIDDDPTPLLEALASLLE